MAYLLDLIDKLSAPPEADGETPSGENALANQGLRLPATAHIRAAIREAFPHLAEAEPASKPKLAQPFPICRHIKPSGERCGSPRLRGNHLYCYYHNRLHYPADSASSTAVLVLPHLEDRAAVTLALGDVTRALIADKISERKAGVLLYALQLALQASPLSKTPAKPTLETSVAEDDELGEYVPLTEEEQAEMTRLKEKLIEERTAAAAQARQKAD